MIDEDRNVYTDQPDTDFNSIPNGSIDCKINKQKKNRKELSKTKNMSDMMKVLPELRVVQPNLIFVIGLPLWMSKERDQLLSSQYFGKFGKVFKVEINQNQTFTGPQGSSSISAYVTYHRPEDAMRAITELDQSSLHGRQLRVSLGTTKYCSQFLKGAKCSKHECMYLHELGDPEASFTKEQMQNGKHTEYMNKLLREFTQNNGVYPSEDGIAFETKCSTANQSNNNNTYDIENQNQKFSYNSDSERSSPQMSDSKNTSTFERNSNNELFNKGQSNINPSLIKSSTNTASATNQSTQQKKQKTPSSSRKQNPPNCKSENKFTSNKEDFKVNQDSNQIKESSLTTTSVSNQNQSSNNKNQMQFVFGPFDEDPVDIDFDPFSISQNGLAELLAAEEDRFSRLNTSNNSASLQDWQKGGSLRNCNVNTSTTVQSHPRSFQPSQCPNSGSTPQRPTSSNGLSNNKSRVMIPPPGFEDKTIPGDLAKTASTSHPPGLTHIPEQNDSMINSIIDSSHNYMPSSNHSSKLASVNGIENTQDDLPVASLIKALDFACIAFRIALSLENPENEERIGLDLNTFLAHLSENTGIDYVRLQSAIPKSSRISCILPNNTGNSANTSAQSRFNGGTIFQPLGRSNEDLIRQSSLWSNNSASNRERDIMHNGCGTSNIANSNLVKLLPNDNSSRSLNGLSKINPTSNSVTASLLHLQSNAQGNSVNPIVNTNGTGVPQGSLYTQHLDMQSKHTQNSNNTWHIDDPAIVSTRFPMESSENNIRSCLWQPSTQPSFMNPQSGSLVRQISLSNNQSSTWSHRNLTHQSQHNSQQTTENTDSLDKKHQSSQQQSIFHHTTNIDSDQNLTTPGSRHLHNVINNYSVS